jgi:ATP-binding cassette subfamily B protein
VSARAGHRLDVEDLRRRLRGTSGRGRKLRGLLILLRPYRTRVILMLVSLVLATAAALAPAPLARKAVDDGILAGDLSVLNWVVVAFVVSALLVWGATYLQTYLTGWVGQRALQDLRLQMFDHLQRQPVAFYERRPGGRRHLADDERRRGAQLARDDSVATLFSATLTLLGSIVILLIFDVELALLTFLIIPIMFLGSLAFRIASADAYKRTARPSARSRATCRSPCRASASCGRSPRRAATAASSPR